MANCKATCIKLTCCLLKYKYQISFEGIYQIQLVYIYLYTLILKFFRITKNTTKGSRLGSRNLKTFYRFYTNLQTLLQLKSSLNDNPSEPSVQKDHNNRYARSKTFSRFSAGWGNCFVTQSAKNLGK